MKKINVKFNYQTGCIIEVGEILGLPYCFSHSQINSVRLRAWDMYSTCRLVSKGQKSYRCPNSRFVTPLTFTLVTTPEISKIKLTTGFLWFSRDILLKESVYMGDINFQFLNHPPMPHPLSSMFSQQTASTAQLIVEKSTLLLISDQLMGQHR